MPLPTVPSVLALEEQAAQNAWTEFLSGATDDSQTRRLRAWTTAWSRTTSDTGPLLSARVHGTDAAEAVRRFSAADAVLYSLTGRRARPYLDFDVPGRVACVWQSGGIWIELWHPDTATPAPAPAPAPAVEPSRTEAARDRRGPGGRLFFTRNRRKETTA